MIGKNLGAIEVVTANSYNIADGELVRARDGSEYGAQGLIENGYVETLECRGNKDQAKLFSIEALNAHLQLLIAKL